MVVIESSIYSKMFGLKSVTQYRIMFLILKDKNMSLDGLCKALKMSSKKIEENCIILINKGLIKRYRQKDGNTIIFLLRTELDFSDICIGCSHYGIKEVEELCYRRCDNEKCIYRSLLDVKNLRKFAKEKCTEVSYESLKGRIEVKERKVERWREKEFIDFFIERFEMHNKCKPDRNVIRKKIRECIIVFREKCGLEWRRLLKRHIFNVVKNAHDFEAIRILNNPVEIKIFIRNFNPKFKSIGFCQKHNIHCSYRVGERCAVDNCTEGIVKFMLEKYN